MPCSVNGGRFTCDLPYIGQDNTGNCAHNFTVRGACQVVLKPSQVGGLGLAGTLVVRVDEALSTPAGASCASQQTATGT